MKIRIKGDSVRFRLTKTEVEELCSKGTIEEVTHFKNKSFVYAVKRTTKEGIYTTFEQDAITLHVDERLLDGWNHNDKVGFDYVEKIDSETTLSLLLEKDFVCLDERLEDQSDNYPNPKMESQYQDQ
ncbi:MAG: hypothetical protein KJO86_06785 [Muriicola sp.]|nr:hypothetical protein [Muriicola sp.]